MPDRYRVNFLPEALLDLQNIYEYIEPDSPQNAVSVARRLVGAIDSLDLFPQRHPIYRNNEDPGRVVRSMVVTPFIIYYRVIERNFLVEIMTMRHGARRQPKGFS